MVPSPQKTSCTAWFTTVFSIGCITFCTCSLRTWGSCTFPPNHLEQIPDHGNCFSPNKQAGAASVVSSVQQQLCPGPQGALALAGETPRLVSMIQFGDLGSLNDWADVVEHMLTFTMCIVPLEDLSDPKLSARHRNHSCIDQLRL